MKKNAKLENETPSSVINYKPLNKLLKCILIQYPIQKKKNLIKKKGWGGEGEGEIIRSSWCTSNMIHRFTKIFPLV